VSSERGTETCAPASSTHDAHSSDAAEVQRRALERFLDFVEWRALQEALARQAESAAGRSAARRLLPALDPERVRAFQRATHEADALLSQGALARLEELSDLPEVCERRAREARPFDSRELRGVASTIRVGALARQAYAGTSPALAALCEQPGVAIEAEAQLADRIELAIGPYGQVLDAASEALSLTRRGIAGLVATLEQRLALLCRDGSVVLALLEQRPVLHEGRPCLLVRASELHRVPGPILHREAERYFVQPDALAPDYNALRDLRVAERDECARITELLSDAVSQREASLLDLTRGLIQADVHQAMARLARARGLVSLEDASGSGSRVRLRGARQPLLSEEARCVPVDLDLPEARRLLLITGPNGGGKTAAMKTLALCAVLNQCGAAAPVTEGALPIYRGFVAVAEATSSVGEGVSTFQAHARDLAEALQAAAPGSLLLLDEIGRGTDPGEAAALAQAVLEHLLAGPEVTILATTHLPELKRFASARDDAACAAVGLDEAGQPTFQLAMGEVGRSYALEAARQAGLPDSVCERAGALHRGQDSR
jgi:DNA mismatch repair protein MutS2